jgi:hypothetical protein
VVVGNVLAILLKLLDAALLTPLSTEPLFRSGFFTALWFMFVGAVTMYVFRWFWTRIAVVFRPIKSPATRDGPSPFSLLVGCLIPLIAVLVIFFNVFWFGLLRP